MALTATLLKTTPQTLQYLVAFEESDDERTLRQRQIQEEIQAARHQLQLRLCSDAIPVARTGGRRDLIPLLRSVRAQWRTTLRQLLQRQ